MMAFGGEDADSYYDEGLTASMKGAWQDAVSHFEKALQLEPGHHAAYHQLGKCHLRLGNLENASTLLHRVVRAKPKLVAARLDLAYTWIAQGFTEKARKVLDEIVTLKPDQARGWLGLAYCAFEEGDWKGAASLSRQSLGVGGDNFAAYYLLGRAAKLAGNPDAAREALDQAETAIKKSIEANPEEPEGYFMRGEVRYASDDLPKALDLYRAAEDRARKGVLYYAFNEYFTRLDIMVRRGLCLRELDREDAAREIGLKVLEEDPEHKLAKLLTESGA